MSYIVSCVCSIFGQDSEGQNLVFIATIMTLGVTAALTIYALQTKSDFTMMGGMLFCFLVLVIIFGIFAIFTNNKVVHIIYCVLGVLLYSAYLIYDTQLISGWKSYELSLDDYVIGALILYIDIIGLFLEILRLLQTSRS